MDQKGPSVSLLRWETGFYPKRNGEPLKNVKAFKYRNDRVNILYREKFRILIYLLIHNTSFPKPDI